MANKNGFDGKKRWGNSGIKGVGANSPAMMEARKGFAKGSALKKRTNLKGYKPAGNGQAYHPKHGMANLSDEDYKRLKK